PFNHSLWSFKIPSILLAKADSFPEYPEVRSYWTQRFSCMSRCVSRHEPLKVKNSDGKSARIFQRSTDQAMAHTRCYAQVFVTIWLRVQFFYKDFPTVLALHLKCQLTNQNYLHLFFLPNVYLLNLL